MSIDLEIVVITSYQKFLTNMWIFYLIYMYMKNEI